VNVNDVLVDRLATALLRQDAKTTAAESCTGGLIAGFRPAMTGFVHVPPPGAAAIDEEALWRGAQAIMACCIAEWQARRAIGAGPLPEPADYIKNSLYPC